jgi:hypothetical protein
MTGCSHVTLSRMLRGVPLSVSLIHGFASGLQITTPM